MQFFTVFVSSTNPITLALKWTAKPSIYGFAQSLLVPYWKRQLSQNPIFSGSPVKKGGIVARIGHPCRFFTPDFRRIRETITRQTLEKRAKHLGPKKDKLHVFLPNWAGFCLNGGLDGPYLGHVQLGGGSSGLGRPIDN
ncbi:hypothetical protein [Shimia abyssi]|uniref:hypothetical protein n=1 Tax=Shimia abyssi TaxID=1662395 RepID=UPI001056F330|nr:hypothetical protein [Shimia abyssi]